MKKFPRSTTTCNQCGKIIDYGDTFVPVADGREFHVLCAGKVITNLSNFMGEIIDEVSIENMERIKGYLIGFDGLKAVEHSVQTDEKAVAWLDPVSGSASSKQGNGYTVPLFRRSRKPLFVFERR